MIRCQLCNETTKTPFCRDCLSLVELATIMGVEIWAPIPGHDGYAASNLGGIRSLDRWLTYVTGARRFYPGIVMRQAWHVDRRYRVVNLGVARRVLVHRAVLSAFRGVAQPGVEALHYDDSSANNLLTNLRWGSRSDNMHDRVRNGLHHHSNKTHCPAGHEYSASNTRRYRGRRYCKACDAARQRARKTVAA